MASFIGQDPLNSLTNLYQRPLFITADRAPRDIGTYPTSSDIQPPGTQWQDDSVIPPVQYETSGAGVWSSGNTSNIDKIIPDTGVDVIPAVDGSVKIQGGNNITTDGASANTLLIAVTGTTNHAVQIGNSTASLTSVSPSATSGVPVISQGASADPVFGTTVVAGGGTGVSSYANINSNIVSGTTTTAALQNPANGASGTVWTSNGVNVLPTWQANTAKAGVFIQQFTYTGSPQTYTPTTGMSFCLIQCLAGGGAGGGAAAATAGLLSGGGGGGSGEYAEGVFSASDIGASQTVTIGAGGVGVSGTTGGNGGTSSVGSLISCGGGSGGETSAPANPAYANGGLGGTGGSGGSFRTPGSSGLYGFGATSITINLGGSGASSQLGAGAPTQPVNNADGISSLGYGGGGGGANENANSTNYTGGNGTAGIIIITEYI